MSALETVQLRKRAAMVPLTGKLASLYVVDLLQYRYTWRPLSTHKQPAYRDQRASQEVICTDPWLSDERVRLGPHGRSAQRKPRLSGD